MCKIVHVQKRSVLVVQYWWSGVTGVLILEASGIKQQPPAINFEFTFDRTCAKVSKRLVQQVCLAVKVLTRHTEHISC